jgi:hypothetical protein
VSDNPILRQALTCAELGWPVFPCLPGRKSPATPHGYRDASTDPGLITEWFDGRPDRNLAVATGAPGPDVLDVDYRGPAGTGFPALGRLSRAGLLEGAAGSVRTPSGGLHVYFAGSRQRTGHLHAAHLDFLAHGGYALLPPSQIDGRPYQPVSSLGGRGQLDWQAAAAILQPARTRQRRPGPLHAVGGSIDRLAGWVATQPEGNRNAGLYWAANRTLEADPAADLSPLAAAARHAGLEEPEITRTLNSARRSSTPGRRAPDLGRQTRQPTTEATYHQAEGEH